MTRVRYTPEVASKPDRMAKDLENAKKLAAIMEEEYMRLVRAKLDEKPPKEGEPSNSAGGDKLEASNEDTTMRDSTADSEDPEPREMGSEAVERRIEKVLADLQEQGLVDTSDEKALEAKRVCPYHRATELGSRLSILDGDSVGLVSGLSSSCLQHMLLLRSCYRPCRGIAAEVCEALEKAYVEDAAPRGAG